MEECNIETHEFEKSKNQLKVFSEQTLKELKLRKVDVDGWFLGLGDHKVTGYELNKLTNEIQNYLIKFNLLNIKFIEEFGQVYNALEALDKDYIQAFLCLLSQLKRLIKKQKLHKEI